MGANALRLKENYWPLIKSRQTFLLTLTGMAGYLCGHPFPMNWWQFAGLVGSLLFTIGGCTSLNMVIDQDIDGRMERTRRRPLPSRQVTSGTASALGGGLIALGLLAALTLSKLYFVLALVGVCLDVLVYTLWLKRRSAWSILWGGLAGGIPILAGRSLVLGRIDLASVLLGLAIVCWIPSHNLTLGMLHSEEFREAGVPVFLNVYGLAATRRAIALSSLLTLVVMTVAFIYLGLSIRLQAILGLSGMGLLGLAVITWAESPRHIILVLYKYSSIYLLAITLLLAFEAFG